MCGCLLAAEEGCDLDDAAYGMNGSKDKDDMCGERPVQGQQMSSLRQESALAGQ
jgi:hypothetical protein